MTLSLLERLGRSSGYAQIYGRKSPLSKVPVTLRLRMMGSRARDPVAISFAFAPRHGGWLRRTAYTEVIVLRTPNSALLWCDEPRRSHGRRCVPPHTDVQVGEDEGEL